MATADDKGGGSQKGKSIPKSISRSNIQKSEALKKKLKESLLQHHQPGIPHTLGHMTKYDVRLPNLTGKSEEFQTLVSKLLIDNIMLQDLEDVQVINFCRTIQKLYPLNTAGDGNCLLHAVSLAIWGIHDNAMLLRRLLYIALVEDEQKNSFRSRWQQERTRLNDGLPEGIALNTAQWDSEWEIVVKAAEDLKRSTSNLATGQLPFESLEEIHIFVLANVIQRPIIVLSDVIVRSVHGSVLGPNNFGGIYLPLLWAPENCSKIPVVLGYHIGHFTPLVNMAPSPSPSSANDHLVGEYAVPLINKDMESLHIQFLTRREESKANGLLQKYMKVTETNWTRRDGLTLILSAKLEHTLISPEYDLINDYVVDLEKKFTSRKSSGSSERSHSSPEGLGREDQTPIVAPSRNRLPSPSGEEERTPSLYLASVSHSEERRPKHATENSEYGSLERRPPQPQAPALVPKARPLVDKSRASSRSGTRGEAKRCVTPGCEFFGALEYGGRCYQCLIDTTKPPPSPREEPRARQPVDYLSSMANENCVYRHCVNMASTTTYPYCHEHAQGTRVAPSAPSVYEHREISYVPSLTASKCSHRGCKNIASTHTFPFCHEHKRNRETVRDPWQANPGTQFYGPPSATPHKCTYYGCLNHSSVHTHPYCHEHVGGSSRSSRSDPMAPVLYTTSQDQPPQQQIPEYEPTITDFRCDHPGCVNMASVNTFPHCHEHYTERMPAAEGRSHSGIISRHDSLGLRHKPDDNRQPRSHSLESNAGGTSRRCPELGCRFYGPPAYEYYCPEHYAMKKSKFNKPPSPSPSQKLCLKPYCEQPASSKYGGLCSSCYLSEDLTEIMAMDQTTAGNFGMADLQLESLVEPPGLQLHVSRPPEAATGATTDVVQCIAPNCSNVGKASHKGLCDDCHSFLSQKPRSQASIQAPTSEPPVSEDCGVPSMCTEPSLLPCVNKGCTKYGDNQYNMFCQHCFESLRHLEKVAHGQIMFNGKISVTANPAGTTMSSSSQKPALPCCSSSPRLAVNKLQRPQVSVGHDRPDGEGFMALQRLENNVRASRRKCKKKSCSNFGNPSKQGFCNLCHR